MKMKERLMAKGSILLLSGTLLTASCAGGPLTTREKGAGIGALGGAEAGGLIGPRLDIPGLEQRWVAGSGLVPAH